MIQSFKHSGLEDFFYDGKKTGINQEHTSRLERILDRLHAAESIQDMRYPGSGLHKLEPKKSNRWAVSVSGNWRITFRFEQGNAYEVSYEDYH